MIPCEGVVRYEEILIPCEGVVKVKTFLGEKVFFLTHVWIWQGKLERIKCRDNEGVTHRFKYDEEPFEIFYGTKEE